MAFQFSARSLARMCGINSDLQLILNTALKHSPIDFGVPQHGGLRTVEDQQALFAQRTVSGKSVTNCDGVKKKSLHQSGTAVDIYAYVDGKASWDKEHLALAAGVILTTAKQLKSEGKVDVELKWGGTFGSDTFKGWDRPHFQIK